MPTQTRRTAKSPKKKAQTDYPPKIQKVVDETNEFLQLPTTTVLGTTELEKITRRNENDEKNFGNVPFQQMVPKEARKGDIVWITYDSTEEEKICYRAKCILTDDQSGHYVFQFYDTPERPTEESKEFTEVLTNNDKEQVFMIERNTPKPTPTPTKTPPAMELLKQVQNSQEEMFEKMKEELQEVQRIIEKGQEQTQDNEKLYKSLRTIEKQTKTQLNNQPRHTQGAWTTPLQVNRQGYHPTENWTKPQQNNGWVTTHMTPQHTYPTTVDVNTQAIIRGIPYAKGENPRVYVQNIIENKNLHHYVVGQVNPDAINPNDYTCKRALKDNTEPDPGKPPPLLIVTFTTRAKKMNFIRQRATHAMKIKTMCKEVATEDNEDNEIYIGENLTATQRELFYKVRQHKTKHNYKYAWTKHGTIYIKKTEQDRALRIDSVEDLEEEN